MANGTEDTKWLAWPPDREITKDNVHIWAWKSRLVKKMLEDVDRMIRKLIEESGGNEYVQLKERKYVEVDDVWELWQACRESGMKVKEFLAYCDVRVGEMKREGKLPEGFEVKYRTVKYIWLDPTRLIDDVR